MTSITETHIHETQILSEMYCQLSGLVRKPALIVGLSRGGLMPGVVLSHAFGSPFYPLVWSTRDHARVEEESLDFVIEAARNGTIVIVDDICDSGKSFNDVLAAIRERSKNELGHTSVVPNHILWASMYARTGAEFEPDVVGEHVTNDAWIHFSWELAGQAIRNGDLLL